MSTNVLYTNNRRSKIGHNVYTSVSDSTVMHITLTEQYSRDYSNYTFDPFLPKILILGP